MWSLYLPPAPIRLVYFVWPWVEQHLCSGSMPRALSLNLSVHCVCLGHSLGVVLGMCALYCSAQSYFSILHFTSFAHSLVFLFCKHKSAHGYYFLVALLLAFFNLAPYSMMGEKEDRGVIPRFGEELFERITADQSAQVGLCSPTTIISLVESCICGANQVPQTLLCVGQLTSTVGACKIRSCTRACAPGIVQPLCWS